MNDRNLLDAAAKIVRDRITPESYLYPQVGDIPPQPPTLRGRLGAVLVKLVRRMLFWYTGQIRTFHGVVAEAVGEQARSLQELSDGLQRQQVAGTVDRLAGLESRYQQQALEPVRALAERLDELTASGTERERELRIPLAG